MIDWLIVKSEAGLSTALRAVDTQQNNNADLDVATTLEEGFAAIENFHTNKYAILVQRELRHFKALVAGLVLAPSKSAVGAGMVLVGGIFTQKQEAKKNARLAVETAS